jgi:hypothetical protein
MLNIFHRVVVQTRMKRDLIRGSKYRMPSNPLRTFLDSTCKAAEAMVATAVAAAMTKKAKTK